jgi:hypothetical protein
MNPRSSLTWLIAAALIAACGAADDAAPAAKADSARPSATPPIANVQPPTPGYRFVQGFYDFYLPRMSGGGGWQAVRKERGATFAPELVSALDADAAAAAASPDEIVGLDFDPFLATQDPCERYEVGPESPAGPNHRVEVFAVCGGTRELTPSVVAEIAQRGDAWVFVNFHYPREQTDQLRVLGELSAGRATAP